MANKNRSVYNVDEDALKRMVAGDTTALEKIRKQDERPEEDAGASGVSEEKEKKPDVSIEKKPFAGKKTPRAYGFDDYREQFLQQKLTGAEDRLIYMIHCIRSWPGCSGHCTGNVCPHICEQCTVGPSEKVSGYN